MTILTELRPVRRIRSFIRRPGRLTAGQQSALERLWPTFGVDNLDSLRDWTTVFGRPNAPRVLDIGYGDGTSLLALAQAQPELDILGLEVHEPGIGHCLLGLENDALDNVRLMAMDAMDVLETSIDEATLARVNVYFPDPWPKKRHHKRRLLNPPFLKEAARALADNATLNIATDWAPYAEHINEVIGAVDEFELDEHSKHRGDVPLARVTTKFERRGLKLGHEIEDWVYRRKPR